MAPGKLYAIMAAFSWGLAPIVAKSALAGASVRLVLVIGAVSGFFMLLTIALLQGEQGWFSPTLPAIGVYIIIGVTGSYLGRIFSIRGIDRIGSARSNSVVNSSPLLTLIYAILLLGERLTLPIAVGISFILLGIYLISFQSSSGGGPRHFRRIDILWPLGAALCYSFNPVLKRYSMMMAATPLVAMLYSQGSSMLIFLGAFIARRTWLEMRATPMRSQLFAVLAGFCGSFGGYLTFLAVQDQPILVVSSIWRASPLITLLCAYLFLRGKEAVTPRDVGGTLAIVSGVVVLVRLAN